MLCQPLRDRSWEIPDPATLSQAPAPSTAQAAARANGTAQTAPATPSDSAGSSGLSKSQKKKAKKKAKKAAAKAAGEDEPDGDDDAAEDSEVSHSQSHSQAAPASCSDAAGAEATSQPQAENGTDAAKAAASQPDAGTSQPGSTGASAGADAVTAPNVKIITTPGLTNEELKSGECVTWAGFTVPHASHVFLYSDQGWRSLSYQHLAIRMSSALHGLCTVDRASCYEPPSLALLQHAHIQTLLSPQRAASSWTLGMRAGPTSSSRQTSRHGSTDRLRSSWGPSTPPHVTCGLWRA